MDMELLGYTVSERIQWEVKTFDLTSTEKQHAAQIDSEENKRYMETSKSWESSFSQNHFPYIKNNHIRFKIDGIDSPLIINVRELKNWLYYLLSQKEKAYAKAIAYIRTYAEEYNRAMQELSTHNTISFGSYPRVFPDGNTKILSDAHWKILNQECFSIDEYRAKIRSRIDTTIEFLTATKAQKLELSRNKKNRTVIKCLNWYLPQQAKLKPDEVNMLSVFNFVAENNGLSNESRNNIVQPIVHKLKQATESAYGCLKAAESLDDLFDTMIDKKILSLRTTLPQIDRMDTAQLHTLASKLSVRMLGTDSSRNSNSRLDELKSTLRTNPILLPNGLFKRCFDPKGRVQISTLVQKRNDWAKLLPLEQYGLPSQDEFINAPGAEADISSKALQVVEENFQTLHAAYARNADIEKEQARDKGEEAPKTFKLFIQSFAEKAPGLEYGEIKRAVDLYKQLKEIQVQDTLLAQILFKYHNLDLTLNEREQTLCNITSLHQHEYTMKLNDKTITIPYKQLDDLATFWDRKKLASLFTNTSYWNWKLKQELESKGITGDIRHINYIMNSLYGDSYHYIDVVLKAEKKIIDGLDNNTLTDIITQSTKNGKERLETKQLFDTTELKGKRKDQYLSLRNDAFHTNVPKNNLKYEEEKNRLADFFGIIQKEKNDKSKYKK